LKWPGVTTKTIYTPSTNAGKKKGQESKKRFGKKWGGGPELPSNKNSLQI